MADTKPHEKPTPQPAPEKKEDDKKRVQNLLHTAFSLREYKIQSHAAFPAYGVTFDDLFDPLYWAAVAPKVKPMDKIYIYPEGGAYYAELLVTAVTSRSVMLKKLIHLDLDAGVEDFADPEYSITYRNPDTKFVIMRTADLSILKSGLHSKEDAQIWLAEHKKLVAR